MLVENMPSSFRLSKEALRILAKLAREKGISRRSVLEGLIREAEKITRVA